MDFFPLLLLHTKRFAQQNLAAGGIHFRRGLKSMRGDPAKCSAILWGVQKQLDELHIALVGQLEEE